MPNRLAQTSSPYLQQHQDNPVDWYPWGDEALAKAKAENKLIVVSIGYSTCHWCHVMAHESFEDTDVAALMNEYFVNIKVDREERPDIDAIYMDAVQALTGLGGWPLNAVCLPDGRPVWGGTYFPKPNWMNALQQLHEKFEAETEKFEEQADRLTQHIQAMDLVPKASLGEFEEADVTRSFIQLQQQFDMQKGGFERVPKFPIPTDWEFILRYSHHSTQFSVEDALKITLEKIAWGGIYDHVGGGFARYSTDAEWHIPHYEKMLYDNGQLVALYSRAYRKFKNPLYKRVVTETVTWLEREMLHPDGAFFSAQDADSEGEEGKFYVWTADEIDAALGADDAAIYKRVYNITPEGNWEHGKNTPIRREQTGILATELGISETELLDKMDAMNAKLYTIRSERIWPGRDDKTLVSWNALMDSGLIEAYRSFGEEKYLELAKRNIAFIEANMTDDHRLFRNFKDGRPDINAYLDDYALLIEALLKLYQVTFDGHYLKRAGAFIDYVEEHFNDPQTGLYFYTSDEDPALIARKKELQDNVIPSSNSVMAHNLLTYGLLMGNTAFTNKAQLMLRRMKQHVDKYPSSFANWAHLQARFVYPDYELVIIGPDADSELSSALKHFMPNVILAGSAGESDLTPLFNGRYKSGETLFYACQQGACQVPTGDLHKALEMVGAV